mmetsp:Transcript_76486/g.127456  ORF Transcript_76486/g.127456 Transcript_76486/m.127456 type:complete len:113 (-) Transcript_76486:434-772(-)
MAMPRPFFCRRLLCSSSAGRLAGRMQQELDALFPTLNVEGPSAISALPNRPARRRPKQRAMPDHQLPPYCEANFRTLKFVYTRDPKLTDFPNNKLYRTDSLDVLFRHFYKNQ